MPGNRLWKLIRKNFLTEIFIGRHKTVLLALLALVVGVVTFSIFSGGMSLARHRDVQTLILILNSVVLVLLVAALISELKKVLTEQKRGLAAARLHVRLVVLFGIISAVPTILVGSFAAIFFHYGIQIWFSDRVNMALNEALQVSKGYLDEHNANIRTDAFYLANNLQDIREHYLQIGVDIFQNTEMLTNVLDNQASLFGLDEASVYIPFTRHVIASGGLMGHTGYNNKLPPLSVTMTMKPNEVAILDAADKQSVRAVIPLDRITDYMLLITRPVDPVILGHMLNTEGVVAEYKQLDKNRSKIQASFVMIFILVALLVLASAILVGILLANQIVRPIGLLITASERVSKGDLNVRVPESDKRDDEVAILSRMFNTMTNQLSMQRSELMEAYSYIDERRRFTEAVLSGVSAGVVGLDNQQIIELPNRAASALLDKDIKNFVGKKLANVVPEFSSLLKKAKKESGHVFTSEVHVGTQSKRRVLLVRIGPEMRGSENEGFVVTFDDITALQSAQRKAAWADIARRIAHEIKNPLTPIQLSAERLKKRFLKEIRSDPDIFSFCVDTIIRHVGDIGRMTDEFSAFARMPQPVIKPENLSLILKEVLVLQQNAHPEIDYISTIAEHVPLALCDRRLINQAVTNLVQNAADAILMRDNKHKGNVNKKNGQNPYQGTIWLTLEFDRKSVILTIEDDGVGLPQDDRLRLMEPYVTHKAKGTGLGLAIVKKIMEDHRGSVQLDDSKRGKGAVAKLILPVKDDHGT